MNLNRGLFRVWVIASLVCCIVSFVQVLKLTNVIYKSISLSLGTPSKNQHEAVRVKYYPHLPKSEFQTNIVAKFPKIDTSKQHYWVNVPKGPPELMPPHLRIVFADDLIWVFIVVVF